MKRLLSSAFLSLSVMVLACTESESTYSLNGRWKASWSTTREAFPGVGDDVSLQMDGWIEFAGDEVTITANGYPGCIFSADTLQHAQKWVMRNDTLELLNDGDVRGISYLMKEKTSDHVQLVLMGDIFLDLTR